MTDALERHTFNELVEKALDLAQTQRQSRTGESARWLSIAITKLEEALTRYNGAQYHHRGTFKRPDPDKEGQ